MSERHALNICLCYWHDRICCYAEAFVQNAIFSLVIVDAGAGGVSLLVDAEQTYLQPAIDACVQALQREHNTVNSVVVFNTIQARNVMLSLSPHYGLCSLYCEHC